MTDSEDEVQVLFLGPLYGWLCVECGQARMGYPSEEEAKGSAESHAMVKHSPAFPEGKTSMVLHVDWGEGEGEGAG